MDRPKQLNKEREKQRMRHDDMKEFGSGSTWSSGFPETPCGKGSMFENTEEIREFIPHVIETYAITSIADVGCGDQNWIHSSIPDGQMNYVGFDITPRRQDVVPFDVSREILPDPFDLVLCIYVLNHIVPDRAERALRLIKESRSTYLLMSFSDSDSYSLAGAGELVEQIEHKDTGRHEWFYGLWKI